MLLRRLFFFFFAAFFLFTTISCQKREEKTAEPPRKIAEQLPEISQERIDLWFDTADRLAAYIRKYSLPDEGVADKRDLMMLVHGSSRTQIAYKQIFDETGISTKEFWNILDEMFRAKKYLALKDEEKKQNAELDALVRAGKKELAGLKERESKQKSEHDKKMLMEIREKIEKQIEEFSELKGDMSPEDFGISRSLIELWEKNKVKFEKVLAGMWKEDSPAE